MEYRQEYDRSDVFMKIVFNTILAMELFLSLIVLILVF